MALLSASCTHRTMCSNPVAQFHNHDLLCNHLPRTSGCSGLHLTPAAHAVAFGMKTQLLRLLSSQLSPSGGSFNTNSCVHCQSSLVSMHKTCIHVSEQKSLPVLFTCRAGFDKPYTIPCSVCEAVPGRHGPLCSSQCRLLLPLPGCQPLQPCLCPATPAKGDPPSAGSATARHSTQYVCCHIAVRAVQASSITTHTAARYNSLQLL